MNNKFLHPNYLLDPYSEQKRDINESFTIMILIGPGRLQTVVLFHHFTGFNFKMMMNNNEKDNNVDNNKDEWVDFFF